jgi:carboxylate-amine ligase
MEDEPVRPAGHLACPAGRAALLAAPMPDALPRWARWNPKAAERPWTVGVEEEVMLLDAHDLTVANRIDDVLAALPPHLPGHATAETHACVVELASRPHPTVAGAIGDLAKLRRVLRATLGGLGLRAAVAGTHPAAGWADVAVSASPRYQAIRDSMRVLALREPTFALHVHVAVPDGRTAVRALDGLRHDLPLLLALSGNSPFWQGRDTGLVSARTPLFSMFPRVGIPRHFGSYREYVAAVDVLVRSRAVPDPSFVWWDARLRPRFGTVEVRIMDAQTRLADAAALAALVQVLVRRHGERRETARREAPEVLAENRFLAARDGIDALFIDGATASREPAGDQLATVLEACRPTALALGCADELAAAAGLAARPPHAHQRLVVKLGTVDALVGALAAEFASPELTQGDLTAPVRAAVASGDAAGRQAVAGA